MTRPDWQWVEIPEEMYTVPTTGGGRADPADPSGADAETKDVK